MFEQPHLILEQHHDNQGHPSNQEPIDKQEHLDNRSPVGKGGEEAASPGEHVVDIWGKAAIGEYQMFEGHSSGLAV